MLWVLVIIGIVACKNEPASLPYIKLDGETMGTYYRITYSDANARNFQAEIEQLLQDFNNEVSTYIPTSTISQFNQSDATFSIADKAYFQGNLKKSREVYEQSAGAFDPTVMPLVNYWGFGYTPKSPVTRVDSVKIDSLRAFVGMEKVTLENGYLTKTESGVQLDFSAVAKGYAIDEIVKMLHKKGVKNYLIDIGGEARAKGINMQGNTWTIGINVPDENAGFSDIQAIVMLENLAIATSGNYRNYYEVGGNKYGHEINPKTGFPERTNLLSASVFASDCATADAWATAFMIMGLDAAFAKASEMPDIEAYFIYGNEEGGLSEQYTSGLAGMIRKPQ